ncbi:MAG: hypothetical protein AABW51_03655 [Nanoarchaeota archaeon]
MKYTKIQTKALWNLTVERVEGYSGRLEIAVKNHDPKSTIKRLTFNGDSPIVAGNKIIAHIPRTGSYGAETGDISNLQAGEMNIRKENSAEKISTGGEVVYIEILTEKGKVKRTDYSTTLYRKS